MRFGPVERSALTAHGGAPSRSSPTATALWQDRSAVDRGLLKRPVDDRYAPVECNSALLAATTLTPSWSAAISGGATTLYAVACSADGARVAAAGNLPSGGGSVSTFANQQTRGELLWTAATLHSPNSVSFDADGQWLGLADGHPDGSPGAFYLFDGGTGSLAWSFGTSNMRWPIQVSGDGSTVAAGSDDSSVYLFAGGP